MPLARATGAAARPGAGPPSNFRRTARASTGSPTAIDDTQTARAFAADAFQALWQRPACSRPTHRPLGIVAGDPRRPAVFFRLAAIRAAAGRRPQDVESRRALGVRGETLAAHKAAFQARRGPAPRATIALPMEVAPTPQPAWPLQARKSAGAVQLLDRGRGTNAAPALFRKNASNEGPAAALRCLLPWRRAFVRPMAEIAKGGIRTAFGQAMSRSWFWPDVWRRSNGADRDKVKDFVSHGGGSDPFSRGERMTGGLRRSGAGQAARRRTLSGPAPWAWVGAAASGAVSIPRCPFQRTGNSRRSDGDPPGAGPSPPPKGEQNRTWAQLADGTPADHRPGRGVSGWIVMFHNFRQPPAGRRLPLSGLYVDMLKRLLALSAGHAGAPNLPD